MEKYFVMFLLFLPFLTGTWCSAVNSRSVTRTSEAGNVNLVEFNVRGTIYGRCTYNSPGGEDVTVVTFMKFCF